MNKRKIAKIVLSSVIGGMMAVLCVRIIDRMLACLTSMSCTAGSCYDEEQ